MRLSICITKRYALILEVVAAIKCMQSINQMALLWLSSIGLGVTKNAISLFYQPLCEQFRNIPNFTHVDIDIAHNITKKNANLMFVELRKLYYNIMRRSMDMNEVYILPVRAKSVSAKHYAMYELDKLTQTYAQAWEKLGVKVL